LLTDPKRSGTSVGVGVEYEADTVVRERDERAYVIRPVAEIRTEE
jgi:hypothetical protein